MAAFTFSPTLPLTLPTFPTRAGADHHDHYYSPQPPLFGPPTPTGEYDDPMASSYFSDTTYRSSLISSRKRSYREFESADSCLASPPPTPAPQKRRILESVTGALSSVVSGVWGMFAKPKVSAPSLATVGEEEELGDSALLTPPATPQHARPLAAAPICSVERITPASLPPLDTTTPARTANQRWVMVSPPSPPASSAGSLGSRGSRRYGAAASAAAKMHPHKRSHTWSSSPSANYYSSPTSSAPRRPRTVSLAATRRKAFPPPGQRSFSGPAATGMGRRGLDGDVGTDEMDEDFRRWNESLKAMIKEGKEALGAKVEVVYDDDLGDW